METLVTLNHFGPEGVSSLDCPYQDPEYVDEYVRGANDAVAIYEMDQDVKGAFVYAYHQWIDEGCYHAPYWRGQLDSFFRIIKEAKAKKALAFVS